MTTTMIQDFERMGARDNGHAAEGFLKKLATNIQANQLALGLCLICILQAIVNVALIVHAARGSALTFEMHETRKAVVSLFRVLPMEVEHDAR